VTKTRSESALTLLLKLHDMGSDPTTGLEDFRLSDGAEKVVMALGKSVSNAVIATQGLHDAAIRANSTCKEEHASLVDMGESLIEKGISRFVSNKMELNMITLSHDKIKFPLIMTTSSFKCLPYLRELALRDPCESDEFTSAQAIKAYQRFVAAQLRVMDNAEWDKGVSKTYVLANPIHYNTGMLAWFKDPRPKITRFFCRLDLAQRARCSMATSDSELTVAATAASAALAATVHLTSPVVVQYMRIEAKLHDMVGVSGSRPELAPQSAIFQKAIKINDGRLAGLLNPHVDMLSIAAPTVVHANPVGTLAYFRHQGTEPFDWSWLVPYMFDEVKEAAILYALPAYSRSSVKPPKDKACNRENIPSTVVGASFSKRTVAPKRGLAAAAAESEGGDMHVQYRRAPKRGKAAAAAAAAAAEESDEDVFMDECMSYKGGSSVAQACDAELGDFLDYESVAL